MGDHHTGTFALHDEAVEQVLEGLLRRDQLLHDDLVDLVDPGGHLPLLVGLGPQVGLHSLEDDLLDVFVGEGDFFELLAGHTGCNLSFKYEQVYRDQSGKLMEGMMTYDISRWMVI